MKCLFAMNDAHPVVLQEQFLKGEFAYFLDMASPFVCIHIFFIPLHLYGNLPTFVKLWKWCGFKSLMLYFGN
jgi:hypothetical protein